MATCRGATFKKNKKRIFQQNLETYGQYTCECCSKAPLYRNKTGEVKMRHDLLTADHVIPLASNGSNGISNLKVLCFDCNSNKGRNV
jgi:5-methylcytosine-specific restriction endonuclease McrA